MSEQERIEAAMRNHLGMTEEKKASLTAFNEAADDWTATCRVCGAKLKGTLAQLREHKHGQ